MVRRAPITIFAERPFRTPFGEVSLPEIQTPPLVGPPSLNEERRQAIRQAVGGDLATVVGLIPVPALKFLTGNITAIYQSAMRKNLTPEEEHLYFKYKKTAALDTGALVRAFIKADTGL